MTQPHPNRRQFCQSASLAAGVALAATALNPQAIAQASPADGQAKPAPQYKKAVKYGMVGAGSSILEKFQILKRLGFDGVELSAPNNLPLDEVVAARDETGLPIHGVVCSVHWAKPLSANEPAIRDEGRQGLEAALRAAKDYGATTVLLVPAVVNKGVTYADAYTRSQAEIRKVLPLAKELGVKIALENVWNGFLLSPLETARYIDEFETDMIGAYFDVGNVVNFGWPEHWIEALGERILKLDIKEYSRKKRDAEGPYRGFAVELLEGDCDWPAVMAALRKIGFEGWGTAEIPGGDENRLREIASRMDRIFAS